MCRGKASKVVQRRVRSKASWSLFLIPDSLPSTLPLALILEPCLLHCSRIGRGAGLCWVVAPRVPRSWVLTRRQEQISSRAVCASPPAGVAKQLTLCCLEIIIELRQHAGECVCVDLSSARMCLKA